MKGSDIKSESKRIDSIKGINYTLKILETISFNEQSYILEWISFS